MQVNRVFKDFLLYLNIFHKHKPTKYNNNNLDEKTVQLLESRISGFCFEVWPKSKYVV